jgi:hypothetical protein
MIGQPLFWWLLTMACVVWYATITLYVAVKGSQDIRDMLHRLGEGERAEPACSEPSGSPENR